MPIYTVVSKGVRLPTNINQADYYFTRRSDTRRLAISFSYRFGKDAHARKRNHHTGGAGDEGQRAL